MTCKPSSAGRALGVALLASFLASAPEQAWGQSGPEGSEAAPASPAAPAGSEGSAGSTGSEGSEGSEGSTGSVVLEATAAAPAPPPAAEALSSMAQRLRFDLREGQRLFPPRHARSVRAVLAEVGRPATAEAILEWVRQHIRFEPYAGNLRGARGALLARSGNGVDQALLLRELYEAAGFRTRLVAGTVYPREVQRLLEAFVGTSRLLGPEVLTQTPMSLAAAADLGAYHHLVTHHVWVEVESEGRFQAADPLFGPALGVTTAQPGLHNDAVPVMDDASGSVTLWASFTDGQKRAVLDVHQPLHVLGQQALVVGFEPSTKFRQQAVARARLESTGWTGEDFPLEKLESLELRVRTSVGKRQQLWSQRLYTQGDKSATTGLFHQHTAVVFLNSWVSEDDVAEHAHSALRQVSSTVERGARARPPGPLIGSSMDEILASLAPAQAVMHAREADQTMWALAQSLGVRLAQQSPRAVALTYRREGARWDVDLELWQEPPATLVAPGIPSAHAAGFLALYGQLLGQVRGGARRTWATGGVPTTPEIFAEARRRGVALSTIHADTLAALSQARIPDALRQELRTQVTLRGRVLLVLQEPVAMGPESHYAWWSFDPGTGVFTGHSRRMGAAQVAQEARGLGAASEDVGELLKVVEHARQVYRGALAVAGTATADSRAVCEALRELQDSSRALCATRQGEPLPSLTTCLAPQTRLAPVSSLRGFRPTCAEQMLPVRCGAVAVSAFLHGDLAIVEDRHAEELAAWVEAGNEDIRAFRPSDALLCK